MAEIFDFKSGKKVEVEDREGLDIIKDFYLIDECFNKIKEVENATRNTKETSKTFQDDWELVKTYSLQRLIDIFNKSESIDWNKKPVFYRVITKKIKKEIIKALEKKGKKSKN